MGYVNQTVAIIIFAIILVIATVAAFLIDPDKFDKTRWRTFLVTAASLGIIITFTWYFFLLEQNVDTQLNMAHTEKRHIEEGIVKASVSDIQKNSDIIPEFCAELCPLQKVGYCGKSKLSKCKRKLHQTTLSYRLFDTWDHFTGSTIHPVGDIAYFLQWASSKKLRSQWKRQYINFTPQTQRFGDKLFETTDGLARTPAAYQNAALQINHEFFK